MSPATLLRNEIQNASYNPKKGWKEAVQPLANLNLSASEYLQIAQQAKPDFSRQLSSFCTKHGYSYIEISHEDFLNYENGNQEFRTWFENYCKEKEVNPRVDLCIVGPCVKTPESAERKTAYNEPSPEKNIDYLRAMIVIMKSGKGSAKKDKPCLSRTKKLISDIEKDKDTEAIKNYFWEPKKGSGFRAHKSLRKATVPEGVEFSGLEILAEVKLIHEGLMDTDKLTRKFINLSRGYKKLSKDIFERKAIPVGENVISFRNAYRHSAHGNRCTEAAERWGRLLYNRSAEDAGLSSPDFLNPAIRDQYQALDPKQIYDKIKTEVTACCPNGEKVSILQALEESHILSKPTRTKHGRNNGLLRRL